MSEVTIFWFRRDLRLNDNTGLNQALKNGKNILPIFIFDEQILNELETDDPRVNFIYDNLAKINNTLEKYGSSLKIYKGNPLSIWNDILKNHTIDKVFCNKDYEPYAIHRDLKVKELLAREDIDFVSHKDQVIHEENEVLKKDGLPYTVYTPYKNKWL